MQPELPMHRREPGGQATMPTGNEVHMAATRSKGRSSSRRSSSAKGGTSGGGSARRGGGGGGGGGRRNRGSGAGSKTTTDHEEIREWAEQRGARPSCVRGTGGRGDTGVL